ncbi:unnamed protein product [Prorocentrum cordatum]|uniref:Uncharacterized protein n=1 Tax=Prorocentrum cordatum TaxID=2364126 RepID=A0ABN9RY98_9DINO|nr:unnamed protein product [Polarella glacialis]
MFAVPRDVPVFVGSYPFPLPDLGSSSVSSPSSSTRPSSPRTRTPESVRFHGRRRPRRQSARARAGPRPNEFLLVVLLRGGLGRSRKGLAFEGSRCCQPFLGERRQKLVEAEGGRLCLRKLAS